MDASCKIQRSIHDVRLTYKYVSRILGTYQRDRRLFFITILYSGNQLFVLPVDSGELPVGSLPLRCNRHP